MAAAMRPARTGRCLAVLALFVLLTAGCGITAVSTPSLQPTSSAEPTPSAEPTASPSTGVVAAIATPTPAPTPQRYIVRAHDTLSAIARRFGVTVAQLLRANPRISNANALQVGQILVIPNPAAPNTDPSSGSIDDPQEDVLNAAGELVQAQGYVDLTGFVARLGSGVLHMELDLSGAPLGAADPKVEKVIYTVLIDTNADAVPEYVLTYRSGGPKGAFVLALQDRATGTTRTGAAVPGTVSAGGTAIVLTLRTSAVGGGTRFALAASAERDYRASGTGPYDVTVDRAPDQQWPRPNPRWIEVSAS
jgi:LysM repeat protein